MRDTASLFLETTMIWTILTCLATIISMVAYIITALYIRAELNGLEKDRYLTVTSQLFTTWQSREFMEAQLWLLHRLQETTWEGFVAAHRADTGEMAFHQVGAFYDRVGTLDPHELDQRSGDSCHDGRVRHRRVAEDRPARVGSAADRKFHAFPVLRADAARLPRVLCALA